MHFHAKMNSLADPNKLNLDLMAITVVTKDIMVIIHYVPW